MNENRIIQTGHDVVRFDMYIYCHHGWWTLCSPNHFAPWNTLVQSVCNYFFSYFKNFLFCYQIFKSCFFLSLTRYCCVVDSFSVYVIIVLIWLLKQLLKKAKYIVVWQLLDICTLIQSITLFIQICWEGKHQLLNDRTTKKIWFKNLITK